MEKCNPSHGHNGQLVHWRVLVGWSELAATSAPAQDDVIQAVLGMNQKHILFPCTRIFQPPSLPQNFPFYLPPPSYLPHFISHSLHLQSLGELPSLNNTYLLTFGSCFCPLAFNLSFQALSPGIFFFSNKRKKNQRREGAYLYYLAFAFGMKHSFYFLVSTFLQR